MTDLFWHNAMKKEVLPLLSNHELCGSVTVFLHGNASFVGIDIWTSRLASLRFVQEKIFNIPSGGASCQLSSEARRSQIKTKQGPPGGFKDQYHSPPGGCCSERPVPDKRKNQHSPGPWIFSLSCSLTDFHLNNLSHVWLSDPQGSLITKILFELSKPKLQNHLYIQVSSFKKIPRLTKAHDTFL